ncbi:MAG: hypothetical protein DRQ40_03650 [Gammaproteobacteria bacterium]|nr:MAG: hypothetical protein DRQ40_03650 [Gammaproteobacteria bacterium]
MMENHDKQQEVTDEVTQPEVGNNTVKPVKMTLLWLAIVILLVLIAGSFWFIQQQQIKTATLVKRIDATEQLKTELAQLKQTITTDAGATHQRLENLSTTDVGLAKKVTDLAEMQQLTEGDVKRVWALAEVEFFLQAANQRSLLAKDIEGARTALVLADQQLKALADPRLYTLRALIADEQLALASVAKVDVEGMAVQLQSALEQVDSLYILMGPELTADEMTDSESTSPLPENWQAAISEAWQEVRSLVVIRHQQDGAAAVLVPEQRYFLYQNLRLKLETARLALLSGQGSVFHASLASAEQWLQQYFVGDERDAMLETVASLQAEQISVAIPDISASLIWLQQKGER